jgi:hypothetical protein
LHFSEYNFNFFGGLIDTLFGSFRHKLSKFLDLVSILHVVLVQKVHHIDYLINLFHLWCIVHQNIVGLINLTRFESITYRC